MRSKYRNVFFSRKLKEKTTASRFAVGNFVKSMFLLFWVIYQFIIKANLVMMNISITPIKMF